MRAVLIDSTKQRINKFHLGTAPVPEPASGEVLVEVKAVSLGAWEKELAHTDNLCALARRTRNKTVSLGLEFAGVVRSDGNHFCGGQRVLGGTHLFKDEKALADYVAVREDYLAELPDGLDFSQAAALPIGMETALTAFDKAGLRRGGNVLVHGASGGVGVYAVQIAAAAGATVTTVSGKSSRKRLAELGAATSYYHGDTSFPDLAGAFDIVFDLSARLRFGQVRPKLSDRGVFINANPQHDIAGLIAAQFSRKRIPLLFVPGSSSEMQRRALDMVTSGRVRPIVEKTYPMSQYQQALTDLITKERFGRIVVCT